MVPDADLRDGPALADLVLDTAYTELAADNDGLWRAQLWHPQSGRSTTLWAPVADFGWAQVFTGDELPEPSNRRSGVAVEPMTCGPDALRTGEGLITLAPGQEWSATWGDRVVTQQLTGLRARLADPQHRALAAFVGIPRVEVVQIVGLAGYDIVILDGEHGAFDASGMAALVAAGHGVGLDAVVRVPELRAQAISAALDAGADAVLVPHVRDGAEAAAAAQACRFPQGIRSVHGAVPASRYGFRPDYLRAANADTACIVMCEDAQALENIDAIAGAPGVDAVFVGSYDLSASIGYVGEPGHEAVVARPAGAGGDRNGGVAMGVMAPAPEATAGWFEAERASWRPVSTPRCCAPEPWPR